MISVTPSSMKGKNKDKLVFAATVYPDEASEKRVLLLVKSIRTFAGSLSQAPIWCFLQGTEGKGLSKTAKDRFQALNASIINLKKDAEISDFPFITKASAMAEAESVARGKTDILVWLDSDTVILQEPRKLILRKEKSLGCRPVHHINIGSRYEEPLGHFWTQIYRHCGVPEDRVFSMTTHIDGIRIRPYFNAGLLTLRPEKHLLQTWHDIFLKIYKNPEFQESYDKDKRYTIFMHQAVLTGVILSNLRRDEIEILPRTYNYPLHLHKEDITHLRTLRSGQLTTFRYEDFFKKPEWKKEIPAEEPLKEWISERLFQQ